LRDRFFTNPDNPVNNVFDRIKKSPASFAGDSINQRTPLCRVPLVFEPAFAGGNRPSGSALAEAYRIALVRGGSLVQSVGSKPWCNITNTAGQISYTTIAAPWQLPGA
jgi:hypothetical protein